MYGLIAVLQATLCAFLACQAISGLELALVPVSVAAYAATRQWLRASGLVLCAGLGAALASMDVAMGVYLGFTASLGLVIGTGMARGLSYGRLAVLTTALPFSAFAAVVALRWDLWLSYGPALHQGIAQTIQVPEIEGAMRWMLVDHWRDVGIGMVAAQIGLMSCMAVSATALCLRLRRAGSVPTSPFREARTPEWVVWLAIAAALAWFADQRWPQAGLRPVVWNTAMALAAVYWLNGLSIVAYGIHLWKPRRAIHIALLVVFALVCLRDILPFLGFFDTWVGFRAKMHEWDAARRRLLGLEEPPGDDEDDEH